MVTLLDTRTCNHDLTGQFIAGVVLQLLSYVAQSEREAIKQRQAEGIAAVRARGVKFGRKMISVPERFEEVCIECMTAGLTLRAAAKKLEMSASTFYRRYTEHISDDNIKRSKRYTLWNKHVIMPKL